MTLDRRGLTAFQTRALLNASPTPESAFSLNECTTTAHRAPELAELTRAGFLHAHPGRVTRYSITPAGQELATYLRRLEAARDHAQH